MTSNYHAVPSRAEEVGAVVVDPIWEFDRRVAEVRADDGTEGYLSVRLDDTPWSDGSRETAVDRSVVLARPGLTRPSGTGGSATVRIPIPTTRGRSFGPD
ncbi:hypothetical protein [Micromonospora thermarum]|uniref:Uncharacterized protein n=1 Tax=Micromonospora thermarum TaxID=2720024 RepID=A0ABX0ZEY1_9ACTN|nr:hypothetical protein [Micromonospora thermarum]NJP35752.1 hypothetical protein [Micromonospora thermarum]